MQVGVDFPQCEVAIVVMVMVVAVWGCWNFLFKNLYQFLACQDTLPC
jgi:hypothetical protein